MEYYGLLQHSRTPIGHSLPKRRFLGQFSHAYKGMTPKATAASVMITEAANRYGIENFWCSPNSTPANPTIRKVAGVSGLTGNPVVICPSTAACAKWSV